MIGTEPLAGASRAARNEALRLLDEISRPLTVREIERALLQAGHSRSWSATAANALRRLDLIAIVEREQRR